jgi:endogenous inhibitor of DNA gyrase (YacG/DUF329 family)
MMDKLKACPFCGKPLYIKIKRYTKPLLAPLTPAAALRDELIDITGEDYVPIQAVYCPICGHPLNRRATPENKPLTLEQLKRMDREPVWIQGSDTETSGWSIFKGNSQKQIANCPNDWNISYYLKDYGKTWIAYPRKMEQEATL